MKASPIIPPSRKYCRQLLVWRPAEANALEVTLREKGFLFSGMLHLVRCLWSPFRACPPLLLFCYYYHIKVQWLLFGQSNVILDLKIFQGCLKLVKSHCIKDTYSK